MCVSLDGEEGKEECYKLTTTFTFTQVQMARRIKRKGGRSIRIKDGENIVKTLRSRSVSGVWVAQFLSGATLSTLSPSHIIHSLSHNLFNFILYFSVLEQFLIPLPFTSPIKLRRRHFGVRLPSPAPCLRVIRTGESTLEKSAGTKERGYKRVLNRKKRKRKRGGYDDTMA